MTYHLVSNIIVPTFDLQYGRETIGLLNAWQEKRLYVGPPPSSTPPRSTPPRSTPHCSNCGGNGCIVKRVEKVVVVAFQPHAVATNESNQIISKKMDEPFLPSFFNLNFIGTAHSTPR